MKLPILLLNCYNLFGGSDFQEYLQLFLLVEQVAARAGIWLIATQDGNFSPHDTKLTIPHDTNSVNAVNLRIT